MARQQGKGQMLRAFFIRTGSRCLEGIQGTGRISILFAQTIAWLFRRLPPRSVLAEQFYQIGNLSLPVVLTTGAFTGMVMAAQTYFQFRRLGVQTMVGAVVGVSLVKELGPVLTALMLAGRVGAAMAAEIGTMRVTEQIDALETLATDPVHYLVLPRFLACLLLTPILTIMADAIGMLGGYLVAVPVYHVDHHFYIQNTLVNVTPYAVMTGIIKSFVFGAIIALVSCYKGFYAREGAEGVGKATCEAVVASCILVLVSNFFMTLALR
jgi:phospholipid/cholesterol/gamma-HCH transport system permease protein